MKKTSLLFIAFLLFFFLLTGYAYNKYSGPSFEDQLELQKEELLSKIPDDEIMKRDLLEAILEFADENTPIDSLYIPYWIFEN